MWQKKIENLKANQQRLFSLRWGGREGHLVTYGQYQTSSVL